MEHISFGFPIQKINHEKRIVTGIATANNIDHSNDLFPIESAMDSFSKWVGNVREMHQPKAVGSAVNFEQVKVQDDSGQVYDGIEVSAYISKGAEDTWQKLIDGTLRAWSIGGNLLKKRFQYDPIVGKTVRVLEEFELNELSLVDNPDNPLAMLSVVKSAGGVTSVLMKSDVLYFCRTCKNAIFNQSICPCGQSMENLGEVFDSSLEVINKLIGDFESKGIKNLPNFESQGVKNLPNNLKDDNVTVMNTIDFTEDQQASVLKRLGGFLFNKDHPGEILSAPTQTVLQPLVINMATPTASVEDVQKSVKVEEVTTEEVDGGNEVDLEEIVKAISAKFDESFATLETKLTEKIEAQVGEKLDEVTKSISEVTEKIEETSGAVTEIGGRVESIETSGAVKKSVDGEEDEGKEKVEKSSSSFWGNLFVDQTVIEALGYDE